jgi:hypothetical protein
MKVARVPFLSLACFLCFGCAQEGDDDQQSSEVIPAPSAGMDDGAPAPSGGGECESVDPKGDGCSSGADCTVACLCTNGAVSAGQCVNGACVEARYACEDACSDLDQGDYAGLFCSIGEGGGSGGTPGDGDEPTTPSDDTGGGDAPVCAPAGDDCTINGDCCGFSEGRSTCTDFGEGAIVCADRCTFDLDCFSNCCVPLAEGGGVCGPAALCT